MTKAELELQAQEFLQQTSHMQIIGAGLSLESKTAVLAEDIAQEVEKAVLQTRVGDLLRQARLQRGLTGEQAGKLAGVKRSRVSQIETGGNVLQLQTLVEYAHSLGFDVRLSLIPQNGGLELTQELA
jgi:HTH-type transcriptional regulator / antitoxin HipB